jgi:hypothetical protein
MNSVAEEIVRLCKTLPLDKQSELVNFARFLQQQSGDDEWERIIADHRNYPKLQKFAAAALNEGSAEPLDPSKPARIVFASEVNA